MSDVPEPEPQAALPLCIEGEMTIYRACELKQALLSHLEQRLQVELDLSKVSELDTAGVQLLLLTRQTAEAQHKALRLLAPSAVVREVLELLNLATLFDLQLSATQP
jgi:anti-sigma B factor antagonist